jgi:hypothetical protein
MANPHGSEGRTVATSDEALQSRELHLPYQQVPKKGIKS